MRTELLVVAGTRPEAIKLAPVILSLRRHRLSHAVCLTGQHPELADEAFACFGIAAEHRLSIMRHGQSLDELLARGEVAVGGLIERVWPRCVIVQGDTTSALAAATAAANAGCTVAHVEAGLRSHDLMSPFPEEANRVAIGRIANLHFAPTALAQDNLRDEGVDPANIEVTGNTIVDALHSMLAAQPAAAAPEGSHCVLVTLHRRENRPAFGNVINALQALARRADIEVVMTRHPSADPALYKPLEALPNVRLTPPVPYSQFVGLLASASLVISDSGGIQEECAALGIPMLITRANTERPEVLEAGCARLVGTETDAIVQQASAILDDAALRAAMRQRTDALGDGLASDRIVRRLKAHLAAG